MTIARPRVLLVDDEPSLGRAVKRVFSNDYDIVVAEGGHEALTLLEKDVRFDMILCDLMMPDVSGIDLYEQLHKRQSELAERMVFMSGGTYSEYTESFLSSVSNIHIEKPLDFNRLRTLISAAPGAVRTRPDQA